MNLPRYTITEATAHTVVGRIFAAGIILAALITVVNGPVAGGIAFGVALVFCGLLLFVHAALTIITNESAE